MSGINLPLDIKSLAIISRNGTTPARFIRHLTILE